MRKENLVSAEQTSTTSVTLSIIIINWNSKHYLGPCIESIAANTQGIGHEVIVVDSGSFDGCGEMLGHSYPHVRFIQSERNVGFARANNIGASHALGDVLLFLNPDTVVEAGAIEKLYQHLRQLPKAGVIGCRLLNTDRTLQTSCVMPLPTILNQVVNAEALQRAFPRIGWWISARMFEGSNSPVSVEAVSGACMMMWRHTFERLGGFSTDYFMYAEDLDLCYKARAAGLLNYYVIGAQVVHHGGGSTRQGHNKFADVMIPESIGRLLKKTHSTAYSYCYRLALSTAAGARLLLLGLGLPVAVTLRRTSAWGGIFKKWWFVLRWGMGLEKWVHQYDQQE